MILTRKMSLLAKVVALRHHQGFLKYLKNTSWMMAEQFLRIIAGLFVGIWVARYLGPEQFGLFSYVLAFTAIFGGIAKLGLDGIMVRELVNHPAKRDAYLGTAFWLKVFGAFVVMGLMATIVPFTSNNATTNLFIFIIAAGMVFQSFEVIQFYFQSEVLAKVVTICKIIQLSLSMAIKIYLVLIEAELFWFVFVLLFDSITLAVTYFLVYKLKNNSIFYFDFDFKVAIFLIKSGWPLIFAGLGFTLFSNIDSLMIKEMIDETAVGLYASAYKLTVVWYFLPGLVLTSVMPAIVRSKDNIIEFKYRTQIVTGILVWFAIFLAVFTSFFSDYIVQYTFGEEYSEASSLLVLLIWINVIIFFNSCWNNIHMINNKTKWVMYFHFLTTFLNIGLNFLLIPLMGVIGAAYAVLFSLILSLIIFSFIDKNTLPLFFGSLFFWRF